MSLVEAFRSASLSPAASLPQGWIQGYSLMKILHKVFFQGNPKHDRGLLLGRLTFHGVTIKQNKTNHIYYTVFSGV